MSGRGRPLCLPYWLIEPGQAQGLAHTGDADLNRRICHFERSEKSHAKGDVCPIFVA
jgi:hypothetical protein